MRFFYLLWVVLKFGLFSLVLPADSLGARLFDRLAWHTCRHHTRADRVRLALLALGPIFVKFGQMLSTRRDIISSDIADALATLQDKVPATPFATIQAQIEAAFSSPYTQIFANFNPIPIASASIAQVHRATLLDGRTVAVKVLHSNIAQAVHQNLRLLKHCSYLAELFFATARQLTLRTLVAEFATHAYAELDLTLEAAHATALARACNDNMVLIPQVYWQYCRSDVMVMQYMQGTPVQDFTTLRSQGINLTKLAQDLVILFFKQSFTCDIFHADLHPGNIQVAADGRYILLDFGIVGHLRDTDKYNLARNFLAFFKRDCHALALAHIEAGWVPADTDIHTFEIAIRAICEPIFEQPLKNISFARTLIALFQMAGRFGVVIQPQLLMLQKTLFNVEGLAREIDPNIDLLESAKPFLQDWMKTQVGWRSVLKTLRHEWPEMGKNMPQIPKLLRQKLQQDTIQRRALSQAMTQLAYTQKRQTRYMALVLLALLVLLMLELTP